MSYSKLFFTFGYIVFALASYTVTSFSSDVTIVLLSCKTTAADMPVKIEVLGISY